MSRGTIGFGPDRKSDGFQLGLDELIDGRADDRLVLDCRWVDGRELLKGPMLVSVGLGGYVPRQAGGAAGDPPSQQGLLFGRQRLLGRHFVGRNALPEQAVIGLAGRYDGAVFSASDNVGGRLRFSSASCFVGPWQATHRTFSMASAFQKVRRGRVDPRRAAMRPAP